MSNRMGNSNFIVYILMALIVFNLKVHSQKNSEKKQLIARKRIVIPRRDRDHFMSDIGFASRENPGFLSYALNDQLRAQTPVLLNSREVFLDEKLDFPRSSMYQNPSNFQNSPFRLNDGDVLTNVNGMFDPPNFPGIFSNGRIGTPQILRPNLGSRARLSQAIQHIPFVSKETLQRDSSHRFPYIAGTFENPANFIRIPFQRDFLINNAKSQRQPTAINNPNLMFQPLEPNFGFNGPTSNSLYLHPTMDNFPLDNGIVFEESFRKRRPLRPGEKEAIYYDGKVYRKTRKKVNTNQNKSLSFLKQDFHRFLLTPRYPHPGGIRFRNGPTFFFPVKPEALVLGIPKGLPHYRFMKPFYG